MEEEKTSSETANDIKEIKDMVTQLRKDVGYLYGLMESVFEKSAHSNSMKMTLKANIEMMKSLFDDKNFEGKEKVFEIFDNLKGLGGS